MIIQLVHLVFCASKYSHANLEESLTQDFHISHFLSFLLHMTGGTIVGDLLPCLSNTLYVCGFPSLVIVDRGNCGYCFRRLILGPKW